MTTNFYEEYEALGKRWLAGEVQVEEFGEIKLNKKQLEFINAKDRFLLISGGFASGKTTAFIIKLILLSLFFPGNRILLGRKTRQSVEKATLPDFFDLCPQGIYNHQVGKGIIEFGNGSQILLWGLDALQSGAGQDIKKAEQELKSLNLGGYFIDQLEEIEERVFTALDGRMRRNLPFHQSCSTTNPANFWAYDFFKANPRPNTFLIETSMFDNEENIPEAYLQSQMDKPESYIRRYVYGEWSPDSMTEGGVFAQEYVQDQEKYTKKKGVRLREFDGITLFEEPQEGCVYQIGVDPSEGNVDPCYITVVNADTGVQAASFSGFVQTDAIVQKIQQLISIYSTHKPPLVVCEVQGGGQAVIEKLKLTHSKIYEREVFLKHEKRQSKKLGFHTNYATKIQLIDNFTTLLQKRFVILKDSRVTDEMKTFIWSDEARQKGAGAQRGFHDDSVMGVMLAYWGIKPKSRKQHLFEQQARKLAPEVSTTPRYNYV